MKLPFFIDLPTDNANMVEQAKRDIASAASEEGYQFVGPWTVKPVKDEGVVLYRVEAVYNK